MRAFWKFLIVAAVAIAAVALALFVTHYRAKAKLEAYRRQLLANGEKLTIFELVPPVVSDDQNGARDFSAVTGGLSWLTNPPPMMKILAPGRALVGWAEPVLANQDSTNVWPEVADAIGGRQADLASLRAVLAKPVLRFPVNYGAGFGAMLPHLAPLKRAAISLTAAAMLDLHQGRATNALENLKAVAVLIRLDRSEPFMISQLVRAAMSNIGVGATWEALQYPGWRPEQLAELQRDWESIDLLDGLEPGLAMERALSSDCVTQVRDSYNTFNSMAAGSGGAVPVNLQSLLDGVVNGYPRYQLWKWRWSYEEELVCLQTSQAGLEMARSVETNGAFIPAFERLNATFTNISRLHPAAAKRFMLSGLIGEDQGVGISNFLLKVADAETARRMLVTAIALKRFQLEHGKYPGRLQELIPGYLPGLPIDFMDGAPLRYHPNADGTFTLYSVGEDGKDDGGDATPVPDKASGGDDRWKQGRPGNAWWQRRDAVWPMPAGPEEAGAYEAKMIASWKPPSDHRYKIAYGPPPVATNQSNQTNQAGR